MNQIALTRPRLAILPRMHSLTWVDNPLNHAVLFMHPNVRRLEVRIEVFGFQKVDPQSALEETFNTYNELGLNTFNYGPPLERISEVYSVGQEDILPNRDVTRTLATQLAEIPRRMPNLRTLCISSYIPCSLYLPALLCTLLKAPPPPTPDDQHEEPPTDDTLSKLRTLVLPRFYACAPLLERLAQFPELQVVEYQFDDALGWGRPGDVGLGKCVPPSWVCFEPQMDHLRVSESSQRGKRRGWFAGLLGAGEADAEEEDGEEEAGNEAEEEEESEGAEEQPEDQPMDQTEPTPTPEETVGSEGVHDEQPSSDMNADSEGIATENSNEPPDDGDAGDVSDEDEDELAEPAPQAL